MAPRHDAPVILFDWGETLMWVPNMIFAAERHLACAVRVFDAHVRPELGAAVEGLDADAFVAHYRTASRAQIVWSHQTHREHSFADRFGRALALAGVRETPRAAVLERFADALGEAIEGEAQVLEHAVEAITALAGRYRLGVVSNYPHAPVVHGSLKRYGLRRHFDAVIVSSETGWMKPHPRCFQPALDAMPASPERTLFVGDNLRNDVKGAKALGMKTAWIAPPTESLDPDVDVHLTDLRGLVEACDRMFG